MDEVSTEWSLERQLKWYKAMASNLGQSLSKFQATVTIKRMDTDFYHASSSLPVHLKISAKSNIHVEAGVNVTVTYEDKIPSVISNGGQDQTS